VDEEGVAVKFSINDAVLSILIDGVFFKEQIQFANRTSVYFEYF
jgi:hypothetical protein